MSMVALGLASAHPASAQADSADLAITAASAKVSDISPSVVNTLWEIANNGPSDATDLVLVVTLPPGTTLSFAHIATRPVCTFDAPSRQVSCPLTGSFINGASTEAAVDLLDVGNPAGSTIEVQGTVMSSTADPDESNNATSVTISIPGGPVPTTPDGSSAELVLKARAPATASFSPDGTAFLSWDMLNAGPAAADRVTFVFELPEGVNAAGGNISTQPCGDFDPNTRQVTCTWPDALPSGFQLAATVSFSTTGLEPGATVTVLGRVASDTPDPNLTDNQSTATFIVGGPLPATGASSPGLIGLAAAVLSAGIALALIARRRTAVLAMSPSDAETGVDV